jgi:flagellin
MSPNAAMAPLNGVGLFGDFSWHPDPVDPLFDFADFQINTGAGGNGSVADKLDLILKVIDGGQNVSTSMKTNVFFNPTAASPTGLERINKMRSNIGAMINRLEHSINNLMNQETNTQAAETLIRDADFAAETASYTKSQILSQSSTAMLAQANATPQMVMQLLR